MSERFKDSRVLPLSEKTQASLISMIRQWQHRKDSYHTFYTKLTAIDHSYYTYRSSVELDSQGTFRNVGKRRSRSRSGDASAELTHLDFEIPLIVAQTDTIKADLADIFLSGNPMFPVVSTPENAEAAEQVETLIQSHATKGRWIRQFLKFFLDCAKYNFGGVELAWEAAFDLSVTDRVQQSALRPFVDTVGGVQRSLQYLNRVKAMDMYNLIWDRRVAPGDLGTRGEYIGYNELISYPELMTDLRILEAEGRLINGDDALRSTWAQASKPEWWRDRPTVSRYITTTKTQDWFAWSQDTGGVHVTTVRSDIANTYMRTRIYVRIVPEDHGMNVPERDIPQMWLVTLINMQVIVQCDPVITAFDHFPIYMGQFLEDGFDYQTKSVAEGLQVFQDIGSDLVNTLLADSRRTVGDRLIYDPMLVTAEAMANRDPAARIPMKNVAEAMGKTVRDAVFPIPYENRNRANIMNDLETVLGMGEWYTGVNEFRQGMTRPGNRTLGEFNETIGNSKLRSLLIAWTLQDLVLTPFKNQLKFNVIRFATDEQLLSQTLERVIQIDPATIRQAIVEFRLADGLVPRSQLANTDAYVALLNMFGTVPGLLERYDAAGLVSYLASLAGAKDLDRFDLTKRQPQAGAGAGALAPVTPPGGAAGPAPEVAGGGEGPGASIRAVPSGTA